MTIVAIRGSLRLQTFLGIGVATVILAPIVVLLEISARRGRATLADEAFNALQAIVPPHPRLSLDALDPRTFEAVTPQQNMRYRRRQRNRINVADLQSAFLRLAAKAAVDLDSRGSIERALPDIDDGIDDEPVQVRCTLGQELCPVLRCI